MTYSIPLWLELKGTGLESRPGRIFIIEVVHIQCAKLFKGLECAELCIVLCGIKSPWSHSIRVGHSLDFGLPFVVIMPWLCRKRRKAIFTHSLTSPMGTRPICHTGIYKMALCPMGAKGIFKYEIIINVLVSSFCFIWIPMLAFNMMYRCQPISHCSYILNCNIWILHVCHYVPRSRKKIQRCSFLVRYGKMLHSAVFSPYPSQMNTVL